MQLQIDYREIAEQFLEIFGKVPTHRRAPAAPSPDQRAGLRSVGEHEGRIISFRAMLLRHENREGTNALRSQYSGGINSLRSKEVWPMSDEFPLFRKVMLVALALFRPQRFAMKNLEYRPPETDPKQSAEAWSRQQTRHIREAWFHSLLLVAVTSVISVPMGMIFARELGRTHPAALIVGGAGGLVILLATLALRGWEVQTFNGSTLAEQVNKWMYRGACTVGTFLIVLSASWSVG